MEYFMELANPEYVKKFQGICGILIKDTNAGLSGPIQAGSGALTGKKPCCYKQDLKHRYEGKYQNNCENNNNNNNNNVDDDDISETVNQNSCVKYINNVWKFALNSALGAPVENRRVEYEIQYKSLYCIAKMSAFLGEEQFFLIFFPFLLWNLDSVLGRETIMVWFAVMYLGQASKDFLQVPRPASPPVVHLEGKHLDELAMPSTHAMVGTAMPLVLAILTCNTYQCSCLLIGTLAFLWCALVCLSRLYLGVHTVLDVVCGVLFSVVICAVIVPYLPNIDYYQQHHKLAPLVILIAGIALCTVCYPSTEKHTAKAKAVEIVSVTIGLCCGMSLNYQLGYTTKPAEPLPYPLTLPTAQWVWTSLLRFVCGSLTLVLVYVSVRAVSVRFFSMYFGLDKADARHPSVRLAHKFVTYYCLGLCINSLVPVFVFSALGIERKAALYECY